MCNGVLIINRPEAADSLAWIVLIGLLPSEGASGASSLSLFYSLTGWYVRPRGDTYFIGLLIRGTGRSGDQVQ